MKDIWPHPTKNDSIRSFLQVTVVSMQKIYSIDWLLAQMLMIKDWMTGTTANTQPKWYCQIHPSFDGYPHLKNLLHQLVASSDQGILKSDRMIGANPNTQPKEVVSGPSFCWRLSPYKKSRVLIDSLQRYWWPKNPGIRLNKRHNWQHPTKTGSLRSFLPLMAISK